MEDLESPLAWSPKLLMISQWAKLRPCEHSICYGTQDIEDSINEFTKSDLNGETIPTPACEPPHLLKSSKSKQSIYSRNAIAMPASIKECTPMRRNQSQMIHNKQIMPCQRQSRTILFMCSNKILKEERQCNIWRWSHCSWRS